MYDSNVLEEGFHVTFEEFVNYFIKGIEACERTKREDVIGENKNETNSAFIKLANDLLNNVLNIRLLRRIHWPIFLGVYKFDSTEKLVEQVQKKRNLFKQDKEEYIIKPNNLNIKKLDPQIFHPLSSDDKNPWTLKQKNQELKEEINQDILRTHSEKTLFQNEKVRTILSEILFIWAKKNPSISYKQGMNEILAIFFIVNYREQRFKETSKQDNNISNNCKEFSILFDPDEIQADTYIIFDHFMQMGSKYLFSTVEERKMPLSKSTSSNSCKTVLIQKCTHIFHKILKNSDKVLYNHLISLSIEPQIFLLRWVRLFYCREFQIEDVIILWDYFFSDCFLTNFKNGMNFQFKGDNIEIAHQTSEVFPLVDYFAISMILFIKSFLLEYDENYCLKRLFKYPPVENIRTLIDLAFKVKWKNEKRERSVKKDDVFLNKIQTNRDPENNFSNSQKYYNTSTGQGIGMLGHSSLNSNTMSNNSINKDKMKNELNSNLLVSNESTGKERCIHTIKNVSTNEEVKDVNTKRSFQHTTTKLSNVIINLTMLSLSELNQTQRQELQQSIFHLKEIMEDLKTLEKKYEQKRTDSNMEIHKNEIPIYYG